mmetsp:Transcript_125589/g.366881  ORF Transcript_125589/g.366881 Transcript_125589/m.366881 type:complete len:301 (-) Transcript_125589:739-1641(-)
MVSATTRCCRAWSRDRITAACSKAGALALSAEPGGLCWEVSRWRKASTQVLSCCRVWSSSSSSIRARHSTRRSTISCRSAATASAPACWEPSAGILGAARPADCRASKRSPWRKAEELTSEAFSKFRSHASSTEASFARAASWNLSAAVAAPSALCCTERDSSLRRCRLSCFTRLCSAQRASRSLRCSSQARSIWASKRWPKSLACCIRSCFSALLCDFSPCSRSCLIFASLSAVSCSLFSSQCLVCSFSRSWKAASASRISSSRWFQAEPTACVFEMNSTSAPAGNSWRKSWNRCRKPL